MSFQDGMVTEDWKKEPEKILLSRKYHETSSILGRTIYNPTIENIRYAQGAISDYVMSIPVGSYKTKKQEERNKILLELKQIGIVLYGNPSNPEVTKLYKDYGVTRKLQRKGSSIIYKLTELPQLANHLSEILVKAGDFAVTIGLRITLPQTTKQGMDKLIEEEGIKIEEK